MLTLRLADELGEARELEAFQAMSTFFVHDLKNAAASLSLMLQNLPVHFDDPEFREDAIRAIGKSVDRINLMIARLSSLREKLEPHRVPSDLNRVAAAALSAVELGTVNLVTEFAELPPVALEEEQMASVISNLVLNARDALAAEGTIRIVTGRAANEVWLKVEDDGCGMDPDFVRDSLFRPFQTTKSKGLGIGVFQSKTIVERHGGRLRVESSPGKGTIFTVLLPTLATETPLPDAKNQENLVETVNSI